MNILLLEFYDDDDDISGDDDDNDEILPSIQIYHSSRVHGTDDIRTSGGYFHMANVFYRQNKLDITFSLYNQVEYVKFHLPKKYLQRGAPACNGSGCVIYNVKSFELAQCKHYLKSGFKFAMMVLETLCDMSSNFSIFLQTCPAKL